MGVYYGVEIVWSKNGAATNAFDAIDTQRF